MTKRTNTEIKAAIEANAKAYFTALTSKDYAKAADLEETMNADVKTFNEQAKQAHLEKYDTFLAFLRDPSYDTIAWHLVREEGNLVGVEVELKARDITVQDVLRKVTPANAKWQAYAEQLQLQLLLKTAEDIGLNETQRKEIEETLYMRKGGRTVVLGQLDSNASIDKAIKLTIRAMTDEVTEEQVEEAIKSYDRKYLIYVFTQRGGKGTLRSLVAGKVANMVFLDIMGAHWANRPFKVDYKKDSERTKAGAVVTVQNENPKPESKSESENETQSAKPAPKGKGKGGKRTTKSKDKGGEKAAA